MSEHIIAVHSGILYFCGVIKFTWTFTLTLREKKKIMYLLGDSSCQVTPSTITRHSNASWVNRVLGQHPLLEEVFDRMVYILIWDREVVSRGKAVPEKAERCRLNLEHK